MNGTLQQYLGKATVADGAWGTELQARGLPAGACPDRWNLENPPAVAAVAEAYVNAGAEIILTNTFRSNRLALAEAGLAERAADLAERGAAISRRAAGAKVKVFASMGPSGKIVMMGDVPQEQIYAAFAEQAKALAAGGADAILCESFFELEEVVLAMRAARENTALPVLASMTFNVAAGKIATMMGARPEDLVAAAERVGASAVGANCGTGPADYVQIARRFRSATELPVWIKPNAGLPVVDADGRTTFPMGPQEFAAVVPSLVQAGANFVGGCCGTTPEHIRAIRDALTQR